jgi:hypothetical protein
MKKAGFRHTKTLGKGHQDCALCHPQTYDKNGRKRDRREARLELKDYHGTV